MHDRHVHSYDLVKSYAAENGACTLVLFDYHHDIHPGLGALTSVNWVGNLIEEGAISKVYWLSGRTLLLPNRNSRFAWLERCLKDAMPDTAQKIRETVELVDWHDLQHLQIEKNVVVTLDFDVFTKDTDNDPEHFVLELENWIESKNPALVTLAFSSAYQKNPSQAWNWLTLFAKNWKSSANWFLECGEFGEMPESNDEAKSWKMWKEKPEIFSDYENCFLPGAYLWLNPPDLVREALLEKKISADDENATKILTAWEEKSLQNLKSTFPKEKLESLAEVAATAQRDFWKGERFPHPNQKNTDEDFGVAVRFKNRSEDRGCLSLYKGISEEELEQAVRFCAQEASIDPRYPAIQKSEQETLFTNISIFGKWQKMNSPEDFIPGIDSIIIEDSFGEKTLLQAAIALERNYSREEFLSRLSNKAGLGFDGWKNEGMKFYKAKTLTYTTHE